MGLTILHGTGNSYTVSREFFLDPGFMDLVLAHAAASPPTRYSDVVIGQRRLRMLMATVMRRNESDYPEDDWT
jgi:hypothetical protein